MVYKLKLLKTGLCKYKLSCLWVSVPCFTELKKALSGLKFTRQNTGKCKYWHRTPAQLRA